MPQILRERSRPYPKGEMDNTALSKGEAFLAEILRSFR
jgi:hypothetical protein